MRRSYKHLQCRLVLVLCVGVALSLQHCASNDITAEIDCDQSSLAVVLASKQDASSCLSIDGSISVTASGGSEPYDFNINGGDYQSANLFKDLGAGSYTIRVKDTNNCWREVIISISASGSDLTASVQTTADNECFSDNGTVSVTAAGGTSPYIYKIDQTEFSEQSVFTNLPDGTHTILVKDAQGCQTTLGVAVARGNTGISFASDIKPIMDLRCNLIGCHGAGAGARDWTNFENVKRNAGQIKNKTADRSMPPDVPLTQNQIDLIGCWVGDGAINN